jgi:hypothetical protein
MSDKFESLDANEKAAFVVAPERPDTVTGFRELR